MVDATQQEHDGAAQDGGEGGYKLPYLSFVTLGNFLDKFSEGPPPPQVDKRFLDNHSGATQASLLSTLKALGLIDDDGTVLPKLVEIASDVDSRKRFLNERMHALYPGLADLARQNGTAQQLEDWFRASTGYKGSTLRKAVLFYLNAAEYAGFPTSSHFKAPRASSGTAKRRGRTGSQRQLQEQQPPPPAPRTTSEGETIEVKFGDAGVVTLIVNVRWLDLPDDTFTGLRRLTKDLRALSEEFSDLETAEEDDLP